MTKSCATLRQKKMTGGQSIYKWQNDYMRYNTPVQIAVLMEEIEAAGPIWYHTTRYENIPSILKNGLGIGSTNGISTNGIRSQKGRTGYGVPAFGTYIGPFRDVVGYSLYMEQPCILKVHITYDLIKMADEALLASIYGETNSSSVDTRPHPTNSDMHHKVGAQLTELYPLMPGQNVNDNMQRIMDDANAGKLDEFLKDKDLILYAFETNNPVIVDDVPPENILDIWKFKYTTDELAEIGDTELLYLSSVDSDGPKFDLEFWDKIK